ncbi:hypothetical protein I6E11_09920 [Bacteroides caecigallinarum]|uniref:hypothetical protein n=1 Tax=Bacteroides caecigallinarum TaxID=1411144 RepID=UPI001F21B096|nr:hypothetical protein [Bacteroides caecigallinarum]MCF2594093.1 hypothetical protein [Bacteroides caecigallinarum]
MKRLFRKAGVLLLKLIGVVFFIALFAIVATSVSPVYNFSEARPFSGPDIFNPYASLKGLDSIPWKRANFHTHTRVKGIFNECEYWPDQTDSAYRKFGYDIVTFSNHNELTVHPYDTALQVNVYEHGINLFKYHKLVFGCESVNRFDNLLPLFVFQKQFQLDLLGKESDFIQMNHPLRTGGTSEFQMRRLEGYRLMELDSGKSKENEYWDWALSAGRYSFGLANDDLHYPDRSGKMAVRCNFLYCPSARYEDIKKTLLSGGYYAMRVPDYGRGDWEVKYARNRNLPSVKEIGLDSATVFISLSQKADSIKFIGQNHTTLALAKDAMKAGYDMKPDDPYVRITAYFPDGEVIYSNPFARYDASVSDSPYREPSNTVNIPLTVLFNLAVLALCAGVIVLFYKVFFR